jgi:hypothetical protein
MTPSASGNPPYTVEYSRVVLEEAKQLMNQAVQEGIGDQVMEAFQRIDDALRADPWLFGEPLYRLRALKLQVRSGMILPVKVSYAVHEERPLVFVRGFHVLPPERA